MFCLQAIEKEGEETGERLMGKMLYLGLLLVSLEPKYEEASYTARRALLETKLMKDELSSLQDDAERQLFVSTGLIKEDLVYFSYAYPLFTGIVSTRPFKNFKHEFKGGWVIRPEIEYGLWDRRHSEFIFLTKEF